MTITVYLADDHTILRDGLKLLLQLQPNFVIVGEAGDGRQAVHDVQKLQPDVVIMDVLMPELNGIEATRQITQTTPHSKIIMLSANTDSEHVFRALQAGATGYLLKASAGSEIVEAIKTVQSGRRYLRHNLSDQLIDAYISQREPSQDYGRLALLSDREMEVLQLVVEGHTSKVIADRLALSHDTVITYRKRIMNKLEIHDIPNLVKFAITHGITSLDT
jgi:DNA-binding NarL/FixJ family response regulator